MAAASPIIRRARRTDFTATMQVLAASGVAVPPPDRATLRRFRAVVADLGADFYVAVGAGAVVGILHQTYQRRLTTRARAQLDLLVVHPEHRRRGVGGALLRFACKRAAQRDCAFVAHDLGADDDAARALLTAHTLRPTATTWVAAVAGGDAAHG